MESPILDGRYKDRFGRVYDIRGKEVIIGNILRRELVTTTRYSSRILIVYKEVGTPIRDLTSETKIARGLERIGDFVEPNNSRKTIPTS